MRDQSELTLRKQRDFSRVYKQGKSRGGKYAVILYKRNGLKYTRTAFVASKKVGNSVYRNRSRRLMKEAYRSFESNVKSGYDIIFVARAAITECREPDVEKQLRKSLESAGILTDNSHEK